LVAITLYLYRKSLRPAITAVLALSFLCTFGAAQSRSTTSTTKKAKRGPRAIAVVEFLPGGAVRLVPIALWIDGHYYDASLYAANPAPMAVEPQTVYEAQSLGEPTGTFTISMPKQVNGAWVADGSWRPHLAVDEQMAAKNAKDAANKPKANPSKSVFTDQADDTRPVLKRAPGSGGDSPSSPQSPQPSQSSTTTNDPDRPVMKRPPNDSSSKPTMGSTDDSPSGTTSNAKSQTVTDDHDPDRPVMKRSTSNSSSSDNGGDSHPMTMTQAAAASNDSDPNRPVLSRSDKPKPQMSGDLPSGKTGAPPAANAKGSTKSYPAISDAGNYQQRSLLYSMSPGERKTLEDQLEVLALSEIRNYAAKHNGPPFSRTTTITDSDVRAYDLDFSNSATIVLTAKLPVAPAKGQPATDFAYFVTVVARVDINGQPQKIFSSVTDSKHLDAYPRMELIDAVDADANGRADLLFRQYSDVGVSYGLYRVSPYQIEKIFEGGSGL
jgi:hypothetical protein